MSENQARLLVACGTLPIRMSCMGNATSQTSVLIPDAAGKAEVPVRKRRQSRISDSFSSLINGACFVPNANSSPSLASPTHSKRGSSVHICETDPQHPSLLTRAANLPNLYFGFVEGIVDDQMELYSQKDCIAVVNPASLRFDTYCSQVLGPLFHYTLFESRRVQLGLINEGWDDFLAANETMATAIMNEYREGDLILILDYRLLAVPKYLRQFYPLIPIGFHLNVPFPSSEIFRCHPKAKEILEAILGSSVISFQAYSYNRHFLSSCTRLLGLESTPKGVEFGGVPVQLRVTPIGANIGGVTKAMTQASVQSKLEAMRKVFKGKRILLGIDTSETVMGVRHKFLGYERFLEENPSWIGEVVLVQIVEPPNNEAESSILNDLASRINMKFGYLGYNPISLFKINLKQDEYLALLTMAEVFLVISERAAYSIPALDYITCQEKRHGLLILSEFIGNAIFMPAAFIVNPWDHRQIANSIQDALTTPIGEMIDREEELLGFIQKNDHSYWATTLIKEIIDSQTLLKQYTSTPSLDKQAIIRRYMTSKKRVFLLDYDGTLVGIKKTPSAALPTPDLIRTLKSLASDPHNFVYIISGRDRNTLNGMLGDVWRLGLSAEHGCYLKAVPQKDEVAEWKTLISEEDLGWKAEVLQIMEYYSERTHGSFVETKSASLTWHYRLADAQFGSWQAKQLQNYIEQALAPVYPIEVMAGKKNIEVRPVSTNKGNIVRSLIGTHFSPDFVLCIGDDRTDEDMFKVLQELATSQNLEEQEACFTCRVSSDGQATSAKYCLKTSDHVVNLLSRLASITAERYSAITI